MRRASVFLAVIAVLALALAPGLAEARAGSGGSFGSRGSRTWSAPPGTNTAPSGGQTFQRSTTPNAPSSGPGFGQPMGAPNTGRMGMGGSPFMSGLMGGLIGAGIGGLLFGHGFMGGGGLGFGGFLGFLLQIFLIVMLVRFALRWFRGRAPATPGGPGLFGRTGFPGGVGAAPLGAPAGGAPAGQPITIGPDDYGAFERLLSAVQAAWTAHDIAALQRLATPEMVGVLAEQLAEQASRGVRNSVTDVRLLQGDPAEAWREGGREYATVAMRFSMIDVTFDGAARAVDGSPTEHVTATELWTFLRVPGGQWVLSAIQQGP